MVPRAVILNVAAEMGAALADGSVGDQAAIAGGMLARAGGGPELVGAMLDAARGEQSFGPPLEGFAVLLEGLLTELRMAANGGVAAAGRQIESVRQAILAGIAAGGLGAPVLIRIARGFHAAGLEPDPDLREAALEALDVGAGYTVDPSALAHYADGFDGDAFAIHADLSATLAAFPETAGARLIEHHARTPHPALRAATLGFALHPSDAIALAVLDIVPTWAADGLAGDLAETCERLRRMRPWLPDTRHGPLDGAVAALAAETTVAEPPASLVTLVSPCDGAGSQSLFALAKIGRRHAFTAILVKQGLGVVDVWSEQGLRKAEADQMKRQLIEAAEAVVVKPDLIERRLADALAANRARSMPPPFGLVRAAEIMGLGEIVPATTPIAAFVGGMLERLPSGFTDANGTLAAHEVSLAWATQFSTIASWFEAGPEVDALLAPIRTRAKRIEAVTKSLLPTRRTFWAEQCAWMAATIEAQPKIRDARWSNFAIVARDLAGDRPLAEIPLMARIAEATVDAFKQAQRQGDPF